MPGTCPSACWAFCIAATGLCSVVNLEAPGPHSPEIRADVANYPDIVPVVQFSEIIEG